MNYKVLLLIAGIALFYYFVIHPAQDIANNRFKAMTQ